MRSVYNISQPRFTFDRQALWGNLNTIKGSDVCLTFGSIDAISDANKVGITLKAAAFRAFEFQEKNLTFLAQ